MIDREDDLVPFQRTSTTSTTMISHRSNPRTNPSRPSNTPTLIMNVPTTTTTSTMTVSSQSNHQQQQQQQHHQHHHRPLNNSYGSNSKLSHLVHNQPQQQPQPQPQQKQPLRRSMTNQSKYLRVIMVFIGIATIFNFYTSSYILKQRVLTSSSSLESFPIQSLFFTPNQYDRNPPVGAVTTPTEEASFLRLPSSTMILSSRNAPPQLHSAERLPSDTNDNEWVLPTGTIEEVIVQSHDYRTTHERRLVVCAANQEYLDFADNFVNHLLHRQRITNFVIVPLDHATYHALHPIYPQHTLPTFPSITTPTTSPPRDDGDAATHPLENLQNDTNPFEFGSMAFRQLTASRPNFLRQIMQQIPNVTIFYNDIDMVWKSNAWQVLDERLQIAQSTPIETLVQEEIESAKDRRNTNVEELMAPPTKKATTRKQVMPTTSSSSTPIVTTLLWHDGPGLICTCMLYLKPTLNNIQLLYEWEHEILQDTESKYLSDQDAFIAYIERTQLISISQQMTTYAAHPVNTTGSNITTGSRSRNMVRDRKQQPESYDLEAGASTLSYITVLYRNDYEFPHGHKYNWYNTTSTTTAERNKATNKKDFVYHPNYAVIVHNNWIKGKVAKLQRFQRSGLWNPSGLL